jgi:type II secretory pathway component GspD/PulD (secretin)
MGVHPQVSTAPPITITFEDTPIERVVVAFAEFTDRSVVLGMGVTGNVTAVIREQPWDLAFEAILEAQGFQAVELESGIIRIELAQPLLGPGQSEVLVTRVFHLRHQLATELEPVVSTVLSDRGTIAVARHVNALVVTDLPNVLDHIARLLWGFPEQAPPCR